MRQGNHSSHSSLAMSLLSVFVLFGLGCVVDLSETHEILSGEYLGQTMAGGLPETWGVPSIPNSPSFSPQ